MIRTAAGVTVEVEGTALKINGVEVSKEEVQLLGDLLHNARIQAHCAKRREGK
jgi:hypothetical protein